MRWVGLSYSLASGPGSSQRVAVWRRLRQLGAVAPAGSLYLLPAGEEGLEAFEWLAQEIRSGGGEALVLSIDELAGIEEDRVVELFRAARDEDYLKLAGEAEAAEAGGEREPPEGGRLRDRLERLERRFAEVARIDFFGAPEGPRAAAALARLAAALAPPTSPAGDGEVPPADPAAFRGRTWVTRPRPHVDRLASVWLIRRFVDPEARIRYGGDPRPGEVGFDLAPGAPPEIESFGHTGPLCTFETLLVAFRLEDPALRAVAALVHAIDLPDEGPQPAEAAGVDAVLRGWLAAGLPDDELERHGTALFEGLYATCRQAAARAPGAGGAERSKKAGAAPAGPAGGGKRRPAKRRAR